jgi:osmotically-inducible protein OsmY
MPTRTNTDDAASVEVTHSHRDPEVVAKHISMIALDGAVTLAGHVTTIHEKHVAVRAAERVEAVRAIADDIEVRPSSLKERADDEIAEEIAHLRRWGAEIPDPVGVQVRDGRVILFGQVESASQRDRAESVVRQLTGLRIVDNLIKVEPQTEPTATDVERRVQEAITQMADLNARSIRATITDGTVELHGHHLPSSAAVQTALQTAKTAPGVTRLRARSSLRLRRTTAFDVHLSRRGELALDLVDQVLVQVEQATEKVDRKQQVGGTVRVCTGRLDGLVESCAQVGDVVAEGGEAFARHLLADKVANQQAQESVTLHRSDRDGSARIIPERVQTLVGERVHRALPRLARFLAGLQVAELREPLRLDVVLALAGPIEHAAAPGHAQQVVRTRSAAADETEDLVGKERQLMVDEATVHSL